MPDLFLPDVIGVALGIDPPNSTTSNALINVENSLPFLTFPADSLQSVKVRFTCDDGTTDEARYGRHMVLIPKRFRVPSL